MSTRDCTGYRPIVDMTYGDVINKETYSLPGVCTNCGVKVTVQRNKGDRFPNHAICPNCGCSSISQEWNAR